MTKPMPCPSPLPRPTLRELVHALAQLNPREAAHHQERLASLEERQAEAQARLRQEETGLAAVATDGTRWALTEWQLRSAAVASARRAWRHLLVDEDVLREGVEEALFHARQALAMGFVHCATCHGTGEGPRPALDVSVEWPACAECGGRGWRPAARR